MRRYEDLSKKFEELQKEKSDIHSKIESTYKQVHRHSGDSSEDSADFTKSAYSPHQSPPHQTIRLKRPH